MRGPLTAILIVVMMILMAVPMSTTILEEDGTTTHAPFSQMTPGVVSDFLSLNSSGQSSIKAIDHHSSGAWVACADFNGTVNPVDTLNSQVQPRSSHGNDDVILFGGSSIMNITWLSHLRSTGDSSCRGVEIIDQNQVVAFGTFNDYIQIGTSTKYSEGQKDAFLGVYNFSVQAWIDVTSFGGTSDDEIRDVIPSSTGFIAVGYSSSDLTSDYSDLFTSNTEDCSSNPCGLVIEYSSDLEEENGNLAFSDQGNGIKFYQISGQDAQGKSVIVGEFKGNLTLSGSSIAGITSVGSQDGAILEIDSSLSFTGINRIGGTSFDSAKSIQRISTGGFLVVMEVTGTYNSTRPYNSVYSSTAGSRDIAVFQLFNNLTINHHYSFGTSGPDQIRDMSLLQNSGIFSITGHIDGLLTLGGSSIGIAQSTDSAFLSTFEFNSTGIHPLWAFSTTGSSSSDGQGIAIKHISDGVVYWGGYSSPSGPTGTQIGSSQLLGGGTKAGYISLMDVDQDLDGIGSRYDSCPTDADPGQEDFDNDGAGDACDDDDDDDGILDSSDNCPRDGILSWISSPSQDNDQDGCKDDGSENQGNGQDTDDDNDNRSDGNDACPKGSLNWDSTDSTLDYDGDGCRDNNEDDDDDNDGVLDVDDLCNPPASMIDYNDGTWLDYDVDGCHDSEDSDIDNDNRLNEDDECPYSPMGFNSNLRSLDWDGDGCHDIEEDLDDDDDGRTDTFDDECKPPNTELGTTSHWSDHDLDGCHDDIEDSDDDNDGIADTDDRCPRGDLGWNTNDASDWDGDGCRDSTEDSDDDQDGVTDVDDQCPRSSPNITDYDGDGCTAEYDDDWDNDGIDNDVDNCVEGELGWTATTGEEDHDGDGCRDSTEDQDDDNDGIFDTQDTCDKGETDWNSSETDLDYDSDGCLDSVEDPDIDNDGILNADEICDRSPIEDFPDHDSDGCDDRSEDTDDDNDGIPDESDNDNIDNSSCSTSPMNRSQLTDFDQDGCFGVEDSDSDGDGILDVFDTCNPPGSQLSWLSGTSTDHDGDGCLDEHAEDSDDDNDQRDDSSDVCSAGKVGWDSTNKNLDFNQNGCHDEEDPDIDGDKVLNQNDKFPFDCRYSRDTDDDGLPNPSTVTECAFPGESGLKEDPDSDGDGVSDKHEIRCGYDEFNPEDLPDENYRDESGDCEPTYWEKQFEENSQVIIISATVILSLIVIGVILTPKNIAKGPNAHAQSGGINAGGPVNTGTNTANTRIDNRGAIQDSTNVQTGKGTQNNSSPTQPLPVSSIPVPPSGIAPSKTSQTDELQNILNGDLYPRDDPTLISISERLQEVISPPIPPEGLPSGWTQQQWGYYGQQYLDHLDDK